MPAKVNGSSIIDQASLARHAFGERDSEASRFARSISAPTTPDILQTTFVGPGTQLVEVYVTRREALRPSPRDRLAPGRCHRDVFPLALGVDWLTGSGLDRPRKPRTAANAAIAPAMT